MRPVVLDTSVVLPAVLSPRGYRRRFWVLLALGALAARRDLARSEADALRKHASLPGSEIHGPSAESLVGDADARYKRLRGLMPPACPEDWRLVGSPPLLGEYERKLRETGPKLDPALRPTDVETACRQIQSVCVEMTDDFDPATISRYTTDRSDDPVVHTALLANATWLIADDRKHISTDPDGITEYQSPGGETRVSAITFSRFLDHLTDIDLDHIDPALIAVAFAPLPPASRDGS
ncbi:MAG: PIN domain-containing protein [Solirubrobacteraceae bacterium]